MALTYRFEAPELSDVAALTIRVSNDEAQVLHLDFISSERVLVHRSFDDSSLASHGSRYL